MEIYQPAEDSFLLSEALHDYLKLKDKKIKILDMGSGSGIQAEACLKRGFTDITATDINLEAANYLKSKFKKKIKVIRSDLFSKVAGKFDLIVFNPPYLPEDKFDRGEDTTAGKYGDEIIIRFLKQARSHLSRKGKIILLLSSFTPRKNIRKEISKYSNEKIAGKKLFFEELEVWLLSLS